MADGEKFPETASLAISNVRKIELATASADELLCVIGRMIALRGLPRRQHLEQTRIYTYACEKFGTWQEALRLATPPRTAPPRQKRKCRASWGMKWPPETVIAAIKERQERKEPLLQARVRKTHFALYIAAYRRFGRWSKAVEASGLNYELICLVEWPGRGIKGGLRTTSLDQPMFKGSKATQGDFMGERDPGFERFEERDQLQAVFNARLLPAHAATLLARVLDGEDLEEDEYIQLATRIKEHPELRELLGTA